MLLTLHLVLAYKDMKHKRPYAAAKEAIRGLSCVAANEWGRFGINVNIISPLANSPGVQAWAKAQPEYYEAVRSKTPLGRFGDVEQDIGRVAFS